MREGPAPPKKPSRASPPSEAERRKTRLADALRQNLRRRKAQARAKAGAEGQSAAAKTPES